MKKILFFVISLLCCYFNIQAQQDVTRFLGIPIDGDKADIIRELKNKGFKNKEVSPGWSVLEGVFNDRNVWVNIVTNKYGKAHKVILSDATASNARDIIIRFNNLCYQFDNSSKYISAGNDQKIPEGEDIEYGLNRKQYQAVYYQWPTEIGDSIIHGQVLLHFVENGLMGLPEADRQNAIERIYKEKLIELSSKKLVWFKIMERLPDQNVGYIPNRYVIAMYYENVYNGSNGDDL